jgi:hypothetical protein
MAIMKKDGMRRRMRGWREGKGSDRQERSSQNVRRRGGVVKIKGKMKTERVCLAGEIDKEWS